MKNRICILGILLMSLVFSVASAAMDNSEFFEAQESITLNAKNHFFGNGEEISIRFSDLAANMFFQGFYLGIDGEPSVDSAWDMYISDAYPSIIRWVDDKGTTIQVDTSSEESISTLMYAPADDTTVIVYDSINSKIYKMTPFGQNEVAFEDVESWVSCTLGDRADGTKSFGVMIMDMQTILASSTNNTTDSEKEDQESPYRPEQFVGNWHCREAKRILQVTLNDVWLRTSTGGGNGFNKPFKLNGNEFIVSGLGTFIIDDTDGNLRLVCKESDYVAQNMVFVMEENVISFDELISQTWINQATNEKITFENGNFKYVHSSGASHSGSISSVYLVGDTLYLAGTMKEFTIEKDGEYVKLIGETGEFVSSSNPASKPNHIQIDGIFVNKGYQNKDHESMVQLVLCYTLTSKSENYKVIGNNTKLTFNGGNSYQAGHSPQSCLYLGNYYYGSSYIQNVYVGEELKMVDTFQIPKDELTAGRKLLLSNSYINGMDMLSLTTDEIIFCEDMKVIAKTVDPEGYEKMVDALTEAGSKTKEKVRSYVNGYYWDFYVNSISYRLEFAKSTYTLQSMGMKTKGKYTICNGYIILTNDATGAKNYLPYTIKNGDIDLDVTTGFDVKEN